VCVCVFFGALICRTPVQVLVISVVFVSFVVVLHIYGKVRASAAAVEEE